jgi:hypothetical protein
MNDAEKTNGLVINDVKLGGRAFGLLHYHS